MESATLMRLRGFQTTGFQAGPQKLLQEVVLFQRVQNHFYQSSLDLDSRGDLSWDLG